MVLSALDKLLDKRQSVRRFTKEIPSKQVIQEIIGAGIKSPTSCNMQLWEFIYVSDPKTLTTFAKKVTGKINWAPACIVFAYDPRLTHSRQAGLFSVGGAMQTIMLKATELGLATCPMAGFHGDDFIKEKLQIPSEYELPLILLVGYPEKGENPKTYRSPASEVLHFEKFQKLRPKLNSSIHLKDWEKDEIWEYRKRIFSVYLWRFHLRFFDDENKGKIWEVLKKYLPSKKETGLIIYPWEDHFINDLKKHHKNIILADQNQEVLAHYSREYKVKSVLMNPKKKWGISQIDNVFLFNKLEFEKEPEILLKKTNESLHKNGQLFLTTFNKRSIYISFLRLAIKFKYFPDVYHKSPFYKWGPINFLSNKEIKKQLKKSGFKISAKQPIKLNLTPAMIEAFKGNKLVYLGVKIAKICAGIFLKRGEITLWVVDKAKQF